MCAYELLHVHDLVIYGNHLVSSRDSNKGYLSSCFHIKDLGKINYHFIEIEVS